MKMHHWIAIFVLLAGCESTPEPLPPEHHAPGPASPETVQRIRENLRAGNPDVLVGPVTEVLVSEDLAAFNDVDLSAFKEGDIVCFIDSTMAPLVCGKVVRIIEGQVHVKYEKPGDGRRAPMKGDLAVAFK